MALAGAVTRSDGAILVLNAGSSSLKASVIRTDGSTHSEVTQRWSGGEDDAAPALDAVLAALDLRSAPAAVGHRVVHGGTRFVRPELVTDAMLAELKGLRPLAPVHNALGEAVIEAARAKLATVPHVASFDTAFHTTLPRECYVYPLPWSWYADGGTRRFGFHGLSVRWSLRRAAELLGRPAAEMGVVVAHLGSGCSATAVWRGRSEETTMGMTPLEGMMMATRSGSIDPGILLAAHERGASAADLERVLTRESGLLGVSRSTGDMRELLVAADHGDDGARLAIDMFVRRAAGAIAAVATALRRLDALVFTGGIGEHAGIVRSAICARLATLGVPALPAADVNEDAILGPGRTPAILRIAAREDVVIAEGTREVGLRG